MNTTLPTLDLDYTRWRCGRQDEDLEGPAVYSLGRGITTLLTPPGRHDDRTYCCCLGLMLSGLGAPAQNLVYVYDLRGVRAANAMPEAAEEFWSSLVTHDAKGRPSHSALAALAYQVNDGIPKHMRAAGYKPMTVPERMAEIVRMFRQAGLLDLRWINVPPDVDAVYKRLLAQKTGLDGSVEPSAVCPRTNTMNENNNHSDKESATALVVRTIVDQVGCAAADVSPEKTLRDLGLDSLDDVELVMVFEEELDIMIPDEDIEHFKTVGEIIDYVDKILRYRGEP